MKLAVFAALAVALSSPSWACNNHPPPSDAASDNIRGAVQPYQGSMGSMDTAFVSGSSFAGASAPTSGASEMPSVLSGEKEFFDAVGRTQAPR